MTMRELAMLANVSISTVSKAFSDAEDINPKTKEHIFKLAKDYGCFGKFYKNKYNKKVIAIICPEINSDYYSTYMETLQKLIEAKGLIAIFGTDNFSSAKQEELLEYFANYVKVDGIISFGLRNMLKKGYDLPIVSLGVSVDENVDSIRIDFEAGMINAIKELTELGHRKIAFIGERLAAAALENFQNAINIFGLKDCPAIISELRFESAGEDGINQLLETKEKCTAIICAYDNIAFGAIKALKEKGYKIPEDYSIVGIDNITMSEYANVPLSSIGADIETVCNMVLETMLKKLDNKYHKNRKSKKITSELILRKSIAKKGL